MLRGWWQCVDPCIEQGTWLQVLLGARHLEPWFVFVHSFLLASSWWRISTRSGAMQAIRFFMPAWRVVAKSSID
jgi:hypothetical protein